MATNTETRSLTLTLQPTATTTTTTLSATTTATPTTESPADLLLKGSATNSHVSDGKFGFLGRMEMSFIFASLCLVYMLVLAILQRTLGKQVVKPRTVLEKDLVQLRGVNAPVAGNATASTAQSTTTKKLTTTAKPSAASGGHVDGARPSGAAKTATAKPSQALRTTRRAALDDDLLDL